MRIRTVLVVLPLLALAACGSTPVVASSADSTSQASASNQSGPTGEGSASAPAAVVADPTAPVNGPETPAATVANADIPAAEMPSVTGKFGELPTVTFPSTPAPPKLNIQTLSQGNGPAVATGDVLVVNYYGVVWGGTTPFDTSFAAGKTPFDFTIGKGSVVKGWDTGLLGVAEGSRVLLTLSPSDGYGTAGRAPTILGTDTLVFVVDVIAALSANKMGQADAAVQTPPAGLPTVEGALGAFPTVTVPAGTAEPAGIVTTILAKGTGAPLVAGDAFLQFASYGYDGKKAGTTWENGGPQKITLGGIPELQSLLGIPVGSRIMLQIPATPEIPASASAAAVPANPASIFVMDVVYQAPAAK
ncbi:FKBP-type peptidyl-prolyl cis-trans isomerase [Nakamurella antarctica]|uniref:peptidylprolyl isomerase n=1 Tax=Nakamurella antarctica TaxID=1902245 RepID=A0A3G8ZLX4_9ACTN|nr:FKBP-type peptidyl-prolyl cis-trans isomerase [Nakamurella antarctica]AZI58352.1 FKBP-type peptidyl-prolyl cis-trans isomerase [Nakamurella antarctica]